MRQGVSLAERGHSEKALTCFERVLRQAPKHLGALYNRGNVLRDLHRFKDAKAAFYRVLDFYPHHGETYRNLVSLLSAEQAATLEQPLNQLLMHPSPEVMSKTHALFALTAIREGLSDYDKAFDYLKKGNALLKLSRHYHIDQDKNLFELVERSIRDWRRSSLIESSRVAKPIFIIGMPRSGTSLVEQIISAHPEVQAGGELSCMGDHALKLILNRTPADVSEYGVLRDGYMACAQKRVEGTPYFTDKMPHNFLFVPVIKALFPEAPVIHVVRNPAATCWSNYRRYFQSYECGYSNDLTDTVHYYQWYQALMRTYKATYGDGLIHLNYDALVADPKACIPQLIQRIGLSWHPACAAPHENPNRTRTASQLQIRQPLYQGSSEQWKRYAHRLGNVFDPLLEGHSTFLDALGCPLQPGIRCSNSRVTK